MSLCVGCVGDVYGVIYNVWYWRGFFTSCRYVCRMEKQEKDFEFRFLFEFLFPIKASKNKRGGAVVTTHSFHLYNN